MLAVKQDPRLLLWSPDPLNPSEQSLLLDFAAYRELVKEFSARESEEARALMEWIQNRLRDQMGTIYKIVTSSYARGRMTASDHAQLDFTTTGELSAFLTPVVAQVLDTVYVSQELEFSAPAPFNDINAVNVINGIVKVGEIERGAKPNKDISAAQNYGFDLRIMRKPNDRKLDLAECRYTQDMLAWVEEKLKIPGEQMPVVTLYKNFMGVGGPGSLNYGLSKRMVQLYLLCLVREGKIRISVTSKAAPLEYIDYSNIASVDFKTAVLDAMDRIQLVAAPEGWEILAPYASVIVDDSTLVKIADEADIQAAVQRLLELRQQQIVELRDLQTGLKELLTEIEYADMSLVERLTAWQSFLTAKVDAADPITFLRSALDKAFLYRVYADDRADPNEVDDLTSRRDEIKQVRQFYNYRDKIRAIARYLRTELPDQAEFGGIKATFAMAQGTMANLTALIGNETRLTSELLDPVQEAIQSYGVRYLQQYDIVTTRAEEVRQQLEAVKKEPEYRVLAVLARVPQLGADSTCAVDEFVRKQSGEQSPLRPSRITRAEVERQVKEWPQPPGSELTLNNAEALLSRIDTVGRELRELLQQRVREKAEVLSSSALRDRLSQAASETFIADLLEQADVNAVHAYLRSTIGTSPVADQELYAELLQRALRKVSVRRVRLADFRPAKRTLERGDIDAVVVEFRNYLLSSLDTTDGDSNTIIELE